MPNWSYRNLFEWLVGSAAYTPEMSAAGSLTLSGAAELTAITEMAAAGSLLLTGAAELTIDNALMAASGSLVLSGVGELQVGKTGRGLSGCGNVLAADCDQWLLTPFLREE